MTLKKKSQSIIPGNGGLYFTSDKLPLDILNLICKYSIESLGSLALVNKTFSLILSDENLWNSLIFEFENITYQRNYWKRRFLGGNLVRIYNDTRMPINTHSKLSCFARTSPNSLYYVTTKGDIFLMRKGKEYPILFSVVPKGRIVKTFVIFSICLFGILFLDGEFIYLSDKHISLGKNIVSASYHEYLLLVDSYGIAKSYSIPDLKQGFQIALRFEFRDFALIPVGFIYITGSEVNICRVESVSEQTLELLNKKQLTLEVVNQNRTPIIITNTGVVNTNSIILDATALENSYGYEIN